MTRSRRLSPQAEAILVALAEQPSQWRYGYDLGQELDIKSGSMYPILMRLSDRELLETSWETAPEAGRPPRHLYRLTRSGRETARALSPAGPTILRPAVGTA